MNTAIENYEDQKERLRITISTYLSQYIEQKPDSEPLDIVRHILFPSGHRWRGLLSIAAGKIFAGEEAEVICLPGAGSVELAHAASMLLDDLPSMDAASMRRGKPCAHLLFSPWAVDLAPALMVSMAYEIALTNTPASAERRVKAALACAEAAELMMLGQQEDVSAINQESDEESLLQCYARKSGSLYGCAIKSAAIVSGASEAEVNNLYEAGMELGIGYQIMDDVADVEGDLESLGKHPGMDEDKLTAPSFFGLEEAKRRAQTLQDQALARVESYGDDADFLRSLIQRVTWAPV